MFQNHTVIRNGTIDNEQTMDGSSLSSVNHGLRPTKHVTIQ
jgi:hypothetical protein